MSTGVTTTTHLVSMVGCWAQNDDVILQGPTIDPRQWFFAAQQAVENIVALLTSEAFHSNVILIAHINYRELQDGSTRGYPSAIGSALGPTIPKYFNTLVQAETVGSGKTLRRRIRTIPTAMIDLKNPAPFKIEAEYELGTGLAELFEKLKTL